ncbi:MAG: glycoside hydrolase family 2 protein [Promethearchaeota archaeon]|jgi:beta-galactosidase/beta-glucuronidase
MKETEQKTIPRPEYPRPQFVRENNWINLNGNWDFTFDDLDVGIKEKWYKKEASNKFDKKILVPFCFQSELSGINDTSFHDIIWYRREFVIPKKFQDKRVLAHFGAIDYRCRVYVNGEHIDSNEGGYIGFSMDITQYVKEHNVLVVKVEDPSQDLEIPRGKQYWQREIERIFYPRISGIWQTVWLEFVSSDLYLKKVNLVPDIDKSELMVEFKLFGIEFTDIVVLIEILFNEKVVTTEEFNLKFLTNYYFDRKRLNRIIFPKTRNRFKLKISIPKDKLYLWDTDHPDLYDMYIKIFNKSTGSIYDVVKSYFGMRKISLSKNIEEYNKKILLNNKPIYQKLFLVQGYWPKGLYTAPSDDHIIKDIQYIKDFGFNGLRTHQKAFDPRFLYWCDKMGVLVWGEIGNSYIFTVDSQKRLINEFIAEIERDFNHPSIITWVPINESWGVYGSKGIKKRASYTQSLYNFIKSIDPTRLVVDDDGWWHTVTDICTRHFYDDVKELPKSFEDELQSHKQAVPEIYLKDFEYKGEPIVYSEMGGFGYDLHNKIEKKWGYGDLMEDEDELFKKVLNVLVEFDKRKSWLQGFCYTELYDQFQEINGLLSIEREPKFPPSKLKEKLDKMFY